MQLYNVLKQFILYFNSFAGVVGKSRLQGLGAAVDRSRHLGGEGAVCAIMCLSTVDVTFAVDCYDILHQIDVDVDGVYERRSKPLCQHLEITLR